MLKEITKNVSYVFFHLNNQENINNSLLKAFGSKAIFTLEMDYSSLKDNPPSKFLKLMDKQNDEWIKSGGLFIKN